MLKKIKAILVDDHLMFREGIRFILSQSQNIEVVAEASNGQEFLDLLKIHTPGLVLMDIDMPVMNGIEATKKAIKLQPSIKIIAISMHGDERYYYEMIHAGVSGFLLKSSGKAELETAISKVMANDSYFASDIMRNIIFHLGREKKKEQKEVENLTKREIEILILICRGFSNNEIADQLSISPKTVDGHRMNLLAKTNSKNTANLVMYAIKHRLIDLD